VNAREQIMNAADRLFGEDGFELTSTRRIAELSGVNKALIHYHFKNKEALFESVLDRYYQRLNAVLLQALAPEGDLRARLHRLIDVYLTFLADNLNFSRIVQRESAGGRHLLRIRDHLGPTFSTAMELISREYPAARNGELAAYQLLVSFYGMIVGYFTFSEMVSRLTGRDPLSKKELNLRRRHLDYMADLVIDALAAKPRPRKPAKAKRGRT
jgi:AcrR family transcriptional regulator